MSLALLKTKLKRTLSFEMSATLNFTCLGLNMLLERKSHMLFFVLKCLYEQNL